MTAYEWNYICSLLHQIILYFDMFYGSRMPIDGLCDWICVRINQCFSPYGLNINFSPYKVSEPLGHVSYFSTGVHKEKSVSKMKGGTLWQALPWIDCRWRVYVRMNSARR